MQNASDGYSSPINDLKKSFTAVLECGGIELQNSCLSVHQGVAGFRLYSYREEGGAAVVDGRIPSSMVSQQMEMNALVPPSLESRGQTLSIKK